MTFLEALEKFYEDDTVEKMVGVGKCNSEDIICFPREGYLVTPIRLSIYTLNSYKEYDWSIEYKKEEIYKTGDMLKINSALYHDPIFLITQVGYNEECTLIAIDCPNEANRWTDPFKVKNSKKISRKEVLIMLGVLGKSNQRIEKIYEYTKVNHKE